MSAFERGYASRPPQCIRGLSATVPGLQYARSCSWPDVYADIAFASTGPLQKFWIRVSGVWKLATAYVRVAGVWQQVAPLIRVSGVWK